MSDAQPWEPFVPENRAMRFGLVVLIGLLASTVHWVGFLLGGALVGLLAPTLTRGIIYGAGFGVIVWLVFAVQLVTAGILPTPDALQIYGLSFAMPVILGSIGGTSRELRPLLESVIPV